MSGTTAPGTGSTGTVEQTWALILALSRRLGPEEQSVRSGGWQTGIATGLAGKTLGLVGVGRLGKAVALVGKAFSMRVIAWSPHLDQKRADEAGVELSPSLEVLLSTADVVSLHLVLAASTTNLLNATNLALLKPSAFLINTSRGPLINEASLVDLVTSGKIRGVGLDVFDVEPLPSNHPLRTAKNVALSPHMGLPFPPFFSFVHFSEPLRIRVCGRQELPSLVSANCGKYCWILGWKAPAPP